MKIAVDALDAVKAHAAEGYPHEICGFLIGPRGSGRIARAGCNRVCTVCSPCPSTVTSTADRSPSTVLDAVSAMVTWSCWGRSRRQVASSSTAGAATPANSARPVMIAITRPARARVRTRRA